MNKETLILSLKKLLAFVPQTLLFMYVYYLVSLSIPFLADYFFATLGIFILGELLAVLAYQFRIRTWIVLLVILLAYIIIDGFFVEVYSGEFDGFNGHLKTRLLFTILGFAFLVTSLILYYSWGNIFFILLMSLLAVPFILSIEKDEASVYLVHFGVYLILALAVYLFSTFYTESKSLKSPGWRYFWVSILSVLLFGVIYIFTGRETELSILPIDDLERNFTDSSLMKQGEEGVQMKESMGMNNSNNNGNQLLFIAYIDNFFEDGLTPNPLYLTAYHYNKFDTLSQHFVVDSNNPDPDLFRPNMLGLQLTQVDVDSLQYSKASQYEDVHIVTTKVYNKGLSPKEFIAPYSAYSVTKNPISIEEKKDYISAYTSRSLVSDWNSAYFIYNTYNAPYALIDFQQQRLERLQQANDYSSISPEFLRYYTEMPVGTEYDTIRALATEISQKYQAKTTIDKVLAVRDFYLAKNIAGENVFKYTDNPGDIGIPGRNRIYDFLFESHEGYCAYFAGGGLFLLRAMGVPSRISVGFLTVDRSDKNQGWYWYYQNQAHAWVQVYFPEVGWIDFDYTIGNDQARMAQQADGTPPLVTDEVDFTGIGQVIDIDTTTRKLVVHGFDVKYKDTHFSDLDIKMDCDISDAKIFRDTVEVAISEIRKLDTVVLIKDNLDIGEDVPLNTLVSYLSAKTIKIDQVYLMKKSNGKSHGTNSEDSSKQKNWKPLLVLLLGLFLFSSLLYLLYLFIANLSTRNVRKQAYFNNLAFLFTMHQLGVELDHQPLLDFAKNEVDRRYNTEYTTFVKLFLRLKYDEKFELSPVEATFMRGFYSHQLFDKLIPQIKFKGVLALINPINAINFIYKYYIL